MAKFAITHTLNDRILCEVPDSYTFPRYARKLLGRWDGERRAWVFDKRDEAEVRALCVRYFGEQVAS